MDLADSPARLHPHQLIVPGAVFGLVMIVIGIIITGIFRHDPLPKTWYPVHDTNIPLEILLGLGAGVMGVAVVEISMRYIPPVQHLLDELLAKIRLEEVTIVQAIAFGLLAGIPEEILFRGGIQPALGLLLTALLFGLAHAITPAYVVYAIIAGLCLGGLAEWRGDLWAATAAHFAYDSTMFIVIAWRLQHTESSHL